MKLNILELDGIKPLAVIALALQTAWSYDEL